MLVRARHRLIGARSCLIWAHSFCINLYTLHFWYSLFSVQLLTLRDADSPGRLPLMGELASFDESGQRIQPKKRNKADIPDIESSRAVVD